MFKRVLIPNRASDNKPHSPVRIQRSNNNLSMIKENNHYNNKESISVFLSCPLVFQNKAIDAMG